MHSYIKHHAAPQISYSITDLLKAASWPTGAKGGAPIYIVELGGGWNQADVTAQFQALGLPEPKITDLSVDGTTNSPGNDADGEVALDIQIAAAGYSLATGQPADIFMVWAQDIAAAVTFARQHAGQDMLVFAASGDNDSADGGPTPANVDCPSSCPHVIGCGGTSTPALADPCSWVVWNNNDMQANGEGTGGGYSTIFPAQAWQVGIPEAPKTHIPRPSSMLLHTGCHDLGRMVPDVAGNADPNTGWQIILNGQEMSFGGTSAVAPMYAGLLAAIGYPTISISWGADEMTWEQALPGSCQAMADAAAAAVGSLSSVVEMFYQNAECFTDILHGNNGAYHAGPGPDPCSGMGVANGTAVLQLLTEATLNEV